MMEAAGADSKADLAAVAKEQKRVEQELSDKAMKEASDEIASLKKQASEREGEAIELVLKQLI